MSKTRRKAKRKRRTTEQVIRDEMKNGKIKILYGMQNFRSGNCGLTIDEGIAEIMG